MPENKEEWEKLFEDDKQNFLNSTPGTKTEFVLAKPDTFVGQIKNADVIYVRGGSTLQLNEIMRNFTDLLKLLNGKVYGGSSAGVNMLARYYYSSNFDEIRSGLGFLPVKVFPHYDETKREKLQKLKEYEEDLLTYAIKEGEYFVLQPPNSQF